MDIEDLLRIAIAESQRNVVTVVVRPLNCTHEIVVGNEGGALTLSQESRSNV